MNDRVPVGSLQRAFVDSGLAPGLVARRMGWVEKRGQAETSRLQRALGLRTWYTGYELGRRRSYLTKTVRHEVAVQLCEALGLDPVDLGL